MARPSNVVSWSVDGKTYDCDLYDIDGLEWRDAKRATGLPNQVEISRAALTGDFGAIAAVLWIYRRRDEPKLTYDAVLKSLSWASMISDEDEDEDTAEAEPSPPA